MLKTGSNPKAHSMLEHQSDARTLFTEWEKDNGRAEAINGKTKMGMEAQMTKWLTASADSQTNSVFESYLDAQTTPLKVKTSNTQKSSIEELKAMKTVFENHLDASTFSLIIENIKLKHV